MKARILKAEREGVEIEKLNTDQIKEMMQTIFTIIGVNKPPAKFRILADIMTSNFPTFKDKEVLLAFECASVGLWEQDMKMYGQNFNAGTISRTLKNYMQYKKRVLHQAEEPYKSDRIPQDKFERMESVAFQNMFNRYKASKDISDCPSFLYDRLKKRGHDVAEIVDPKQVTADERRKAMKLGDIIENDELKLKREAVAEYFDSVETIQY